MRWRRLATAWWAAACSVAVAATPAQVPQPPPRQALLQPVVAAAVARGFAGEVLVADPQQVLFEAVAGLADRGRGRPHRVGQRWRWASVSKQVAAALLMQQVDQGRVALDDPVARHLPAFGGPMARPVTVRHLLQHTAGLPNPDDSPPGTDGLPGFYAQPSAARLAYCAGPPKRPPGERFDYNNCDTLLLAALLEQLTGRPYAEQVQTQLARPLGLGSLQLVQGLPTSPVQAYDAQGATVPSPPLAGYGAAAALEGSARDLLAFDRALMARQIVSEAGTRTMWTGEPRWGHVALGAWAFEAPLAGCAGLVALVERRGSVGGIQVRNIIAPASGRVVIVFTNQADFEFGEVWQGRGFSHDLLAAAICPGAG